MVALDTNVIIYLHDNDNTFIVASALEADCDILYSEDFHHHLLVNDRLKIINPFL
jgi:predicted nucleic acid-binding protein